MARHGYQSMRDLLAVNRRDFLKVSSALGAGILLGTPTAWAQDETKEQPPAKPETNLKDVQDVPRLDGLSLPGRFPGRVVEIHDEQALVDDQFDAAVIEAMFERGVTDLTGRNLADSFGLFFSPDDVVGIKVNPVGAGLISTRLEVVDAIVAWLEAGGLPRRNIIIWDRFESMLSEAGFTPERYPGIGLEGLQILDEAAMEEGNEDHSGWLDENGQHRSADLFDPDVYYWADVEAPQDMNYLNQ
ncbi:MAG: twin-arginine translocation signal domain-containing protein, partial [bacterium]